MKSLPLLLLLASPIGAAESDVRKDIPYVEPKNERQTLDVYASGSGTNRPVVFYIHGGGWRKGDKGGVGRKPEAFAERGCVLVSTNYRFYPNVTVKEMTADIAKAIRWVHDHADDFGGDPSRIIVMGHSAGAHLAALVCTDESYLQAEGLPLSIIKGCVPIDVSVYDIPKRLTDAGSGAAVGNFKELFGPGETEQRDYSPVAHVERGKHIPAFLILHVADKPESTEQSKWFAEKLREAGVSATVVPGEGKTHGTINSDLGLPDDKPTIELYKFFDMVLGNVGSAKG
jgi:acetyl esterase/lipase